MDATQNRALAAWMLEKGYSSRELADLVNRTVGELTGKLGGLDDSSIRAWRSGRVRCPKGAQLAALELIGGRTAGALGFVRRTRPRKCTQEPSMERRNFMTTAVAVVAGSVATAPAAAASPRRVGMADVALIHQRFADIIASDHRHGGQRSIEQQAAELADEALTLQASGSASQRVRASLYGSAASFRSSAMWAAIDGRRFDGAVVHMREAQALAEMSGDQAIKFRIWSHAGTMYRHMGRPAEAAAANDVARNLSLTRRDPMFASLGLARGAAIHAAAGDRRAVRRSFGQAQEAMCRADRSEVRPVWLNAFYDEAEIDSLALSAYLSLGDWAMAEAHGHRCLAGLRPHMVRSRAITTTRLARAQLEQGEVESALTTAVQVPADAATGHPRVALMLDQFGQRLRQVAPRSRQAAVWQAHTVRMKVSAR
ncbi:XRE family transcriptional regulator [Streptomyces sp. H27-H1]|uniref:XRE family transcriptional regulator n=1 Tax=Streptomyces sp. H27-H1 TaxID=2996461 RepID=UPI00226D915F|nr:XRE family transcriptional regulator [Streptomyces sp. H27-H1]MCY0932155.1 XRE family transcriptional regulator [Streptomyces sp. H27-H1]